MKRILYPLFLNLSFPIIVLLINSELIAQTGGKYALQFDGRDDYVIVEDSPDLRIPGELTIEVWALSSKTYYDPAANIVAKTDMSYQIGTSFFEDSKTSGINLFYSYYDGNDYPFIEADQHSYFEQWVHYAVTKTSDQLVSFYINGKFVNSVQMHTPVQIENGPLLIGSGGTYEFENFSGALDELRIWNKSKSVKEIQDDMHKTLTGHESGLVAYYQFNETSGNTTLDYSLNDHTGYLINYPTRIISTAPVNAITAADNDQIVSDYKLLQNYPNPFNPSTTISFSIPEINFVTLKVYDLVGTEIATLVNQEMTQGNHEVNFNAEGLTSGIYFYTLQAGNFKETKKLMLLR
jgi:hypothetical protein